MKKDILNRSDIEQIMLLFYEKIRANAGINFFFTEVVQVDWEKHITLMCDFWENVLLYTGNYQGNPIEIHKRLHEKHKTESVHFQMWKQLFNETVDSLFEGKNADKMKEHAEAIAEVMLQKL